MRKVLTALFIILFINLYGQVKQEQAIQWANTQLKSMTLDEKIGQLFMIRAHSDLGEDHIKSVEEQIKKYHVGGLCFFQGTPTKQIQLTNKYQRLSKIPLMVAQDAEWGLGMRLIKDGLSFPKQLTLGAIKENVMVYDMGKQIAEDLKTVGVHINFAPVVDVNNNPDNPVIHNRSFGEDIYNVATKSFAYTKGLQDNGVFACAKHFPGHGDTDIDSHYDLPLIPHSKARLDSLELMPFRVMSQLGVESVMTAHLAVPALDASPNRPTSLSRKVVTELLQEQMQFEGLIFTDGLEMKGVANHFKPGDMELEAIKAGNDILLLPIEIEKAHAKLKEAIQNKSLSSSVIDQKVLKILKAKYKLGLNIKPPTLSTYKLDEKLKSKEAIALKYNLYEKAVTLVKDQNRIIPVKANAIQKTATLSLGADSKTTFQKELEKFGIKKHFHAGDALNETTKSKIVNGLNNYETVIIGIHDMSISKKKNFGISQKMFDLIFQLNTNKEIVLVIFGSPYSISFFEAIPTIIAAYEDDELMQQAVVQDLMGVNAINGKLPVTAGQNFPIKTGIERPGYYRLGYANPEIMGINSDTLMQIDSIVADMIKQKAAPGCQVLAVKNNKIFFKKSYGYHTYQKKSEVKNDDIFDVASVTKILATTISLMKLYEESKIELYDPLDKYLPALDTTNKGDLIIEDVLAHHSGLPGWIPFYEDTMDKESKKPKRISEYFKNEQTEGYNVKVNQGLWIRNDWQDSIYNMIYNCDLREKRDYRYSDLGFYMFRQMIEKLSGQSIEAYVDQNFYKPLGLSKTLFNPLNKFPVAKIPPTEKDEYFRLSTVHGYVHDMGAAMLGGVSGHAGLFSNSEELAILMQMLLNGGRYQGVQYLDPRTIKTFTTRYYKSSRRGLGFDMKELDADKYMNISEEASALTFGHLGFTGISVFADPKHDFIYIFLSNRTFPTMKNSKFSKNNYRPKIQSVFYNAMKKRLLN